MEKLDERFWYSVFALITAVELEAVRKKHHRATISNAARKALWLHTKTGKVGFVIGWAALSVWLMPHLFKQIEGSFTDAVTVDS